MRPGKRNSSSYLLAGMFLFLCRCTRHSAQTPKPIDSQLAHAYVDAYARKTADKLEYGNSSPDGSFGGLVSNVRLDFDAPRQTFIVRAIIEASLARFDRRTDVWEKLHKIEAEQPSEVNNAKFDYVTGLISFTDEPGLYLRRDFHDNRYSPQEMTQIISTLSTTAYVWHRAKLGQTLKEANAARKAQQK